MQGLSYSEFAYSNLRVLNPGAASGAPVPPDATLRLSVDVTNKGAWVGRALPTPRAHNRSGVRDARAFTSSAFTRCQAARGPSETKGKWRRHLHTEVAPAQRPLFPPRPYLRNPASATLPPRPYLRRLAGEEVAQLYIRRLFASVTTPLKSLKDFQRAPHHGTQGEGKGGHGM